jgi:chemotaxis protein MotB
MARNQRTDLKPIIIRRVKKTPGGHHGGAWKIAYADFVTAMMAFFLLMWLLGSTTKGDLQGIAEYFRTPLKVALAGGSGAGDTSSIIKGGGKDLTRSYGQVKEGETAPQRKTVNLHAAKREMARLERQRLDELKRKLDAMVEAQATLSQFRNQIRLDITAEGLRVQIVDEQNRPMFDTGSARLRDYTREILRQIAPVLNGVENRIALSGHTDAAPYVSGERGYSNWELSADRANASRRELVAGGMDERKIVRVVGLASSALLQADDPLHPANRRISIVVLTKQAEDAVRQDLGSIDSKEGEETQ